MPHRITLIPGDGIGPELAEATRHVLDATGIAFEWEVQDAGEATIASEGTPLPERVLESIRRNKVALKGPITTPVGSGFRSVNVGLRQALNLYANLRPARSMVGVPSRYDDVDLVIVRENTEDLYDVLVLPNLYGDIVSDLAAGLVGGLGVAPGANIGEDGAVFEPVHGSAPKYAGQNKANPTALILSGALMLRHLGYAEVGERLETAVRHVIAEGRATTSDLGGTTGTSQFADAVIERLAALTPSGTPAGAAA